MAHQQKRQQIRLYCAIHIGSHWKIQDRRQTMNAWTVKMTVWNSEVNQGEFGKELAWLENLESENKKEDALHEEN